MERHQRMTLWWAAAGLCVVLAAGCGQPRGTDVPQAVKLAMGYIPNVQFAPFYVAAEKGYFADEGIQVQFDYGFETDLLKLVGSDELQFAVASGDQVILARSQGLPVVYVMNWYRRFPVCVMALAENGMRTPEELLHRRIGIPGLWGASYIGWRALLDAVRMKEEDFELVSIGYTQVAALKEGQVEAAVCYAMNEPVQMEASGEKLNVIYVADYANLVSNGLVTNDKSARERSRLVQGMVRAALRGLDTTLASPDEAFDIAAKYVPEIANDEATRTLNRAILAKSLEFWSAAPGELGRSNREEWEASQATMWRMGLVSSEADVTSMFTNRFIVEPPK